MKQWAPLRGNASACYSHGNETTLWWTKLYFPAMECRGVRLSIVDESQHSPSIVCVEWAPSKLPTLLWIAVDPSRRQEE